MSICELVLFVWGNDSLTSRGSRAVASWWNAATEDVGMHTFVGGVIFWITLSKGIMMWVRGRGKGGKGRQGKAGKHKRARHETKESWDRGEGTRQPRRHKTTRQHDTTGRNTWEKDKTRKDTRRDDTTENDTEDAKKNYTKKHNKLVFPFSKIIKCFVDQKTELSCNSSSSKLQFSCRTSPSVGFLSPHSRATSPWLILARKATSVWTIAIMFQTQTIPDGELLLVLKKTCHDLFDWPRVLGMLLDLVTKTLCCNPCGASSLAISGLSNHVRS